jgi:predicted acylesterase/phospholipase RssA
MEDNVSIGETPKTEQSINEEESKEFALIMKGGGAKGLAYVGALQVLEQYGYKFTWFVGTSAGAITAVLLAAGYTAD